MGEEEEEDLSKDEEEEEHVIKIEIENHPLDLGTLVLTRRRT